MQQATNPPTEVRARWAWAEPAVWTDRMLTTLENGVQTSRWYSLIDKVYARANLMAAYAKVASNDGAPGVDHVTTSAFGLRLSQQVDCLHESLRQQSYRPQAIRRVYIDKAGTQQKRPLGIPTVRDRLVQAALKQVLEPIFERDFAEHSYGFRPGRSCKDALRRVDALLKGGYGYIVEADLRSYFDTIPHHKLLARIREKVSDGRILALVELFLKQGVLEEGRIYEPEAGSPQGAVISPLLSNIYLDGLDHHMAEAGYAMVRYADDFVVLCRSESEAEAAMEQVKSWVEEAGLDLHPDKSGIALAAMGFDFLGYHFASGTRWPSKKSLSRFKAVIRAKTKRTSGHSLRAIIESVNETLRGWYGYFKHSRGRTFAGLDAWIRRRLRSILRRRAGRRGPSRSRDNRRWPNVYFACHGLFSLKAAYDRERQSSLR